MKMAKEFYVDRETSIKRLEKIIPMILQNIGLNDKYR